MLDAADLFAVEIILKLLFQLAHARHVLCGKVFGHLKANAQQTDLIPWRTAKLLYLPWQGNRLPVAVVKIIFDEVEVERSAAFVSRLSSK